MNFVVRHASMEDLDHISELEAVCFPQEEAATRESFSGRLQAYPECFWLLEAEGSIVSMVNGMASDECRLRDEMYSDSSLHNAVGAWQMIFGVETRPEYRGRGCAGRLLKEMLAEVRQRGRQGVILTCKEELISFYEQFGFVNEGLSQSKHGGEVWYQMKLTF